MKYKAGDKVRIRSKEWYDEYKDEHGEIRGAFFDKERAKLCGSIQTIASGAILGSGIIIYSIEAAYEFIGEEAIEGLVEDETTILNGKEVMLALKDIELPSGSTTIWDCPDGYIFKDENGNVINAQKIVLEKKEKEYPKTYEECCKVLGINRHDVDIDLPQPYQQKMFNFFKLLICRDAYWKVYGEEMGLGKPWEPDFTDKYSKSHVITAASGIIHTTWTNKQSYILAFPTEEMRDAFYENFKELIESLKELL